MTNWFWSPAMHVCGLVLRNVPDAGGPGGPEGGGGNVAFHDGSGAVVPDDAPADPPNPDDSAPDGQAPPKAVTTDDEDPDSDDLDEAEQKDLQQRDPKVAKRLRKLAARDRRATPIIQALKGLGVDPKDPAAVAAFLKNAVTPKPAIVPAPTAAAKPAEPDRPKYQPLRADLAFDDTPFREWDLTVPSNKALFEHLKGNHDARMHQNLLTNGFMAMADEVEGLKAQIKALTDGTKAEKTQAEVQKWRTVVNDAASKIKDPELADSFRHAIAGEVRFERSQGRTPDPQAIVQKHLARLLKTGQVTAGEAAKATAAAQVMADRNRSAPTRAALAPGGQPASATADRSRETLRTINRRVVGASYIGSRG